MKKLFNIIMLLSGMIIMTSCEDEIGPFLGVFDPPAIQLPASGKSYVLAKSDAANAFETFKWSKADFGYDAAVTYVLQLDKGGNNFKEAIDIATVNTTETSLTIGEMNTKLLTLGLPHSVSRAVELRVMATISPLVDTLYSGNLSLNVTPYEVVIIYPEIFVPGNYQGASGYTSDWSPDKAPSLYSLKSDNKYEGYVYLGVAAPEFKFTKEKNWTLNWGDDGADGSLDAGGANISKPTGYYKMNVNLNNLTYSVTKTDWGVIGDATPGGWDNDTNMTYNKDTKVWTVTLNLTAAKIKFRANDAWTLNYGDKGANFTLEEGGDDIVVPSAGNYTVTLDLSKAIYTYSLKKN